MRTRRHPGFTAAALFRHGGVVHDEPVPGRLGQGEGGASADRMEQELGAVLDGCAAFLEQQAKVNA